MCIKEAIITFENAIINDIVFSAMKAYDYNCNLLESIEAVTADAKEYSNILKSAVDNRCDILSLEDLTRMDDGTYQSCFLIHGSPPFLFTFSFSNSIVEWDEYSGEAWYESHKPGNT